MASNQSTSRPHRLERFYAPAGMAESVVDHLALEEPLEIRLGYYPQGPAGEKVYRSLSITMRTPGEDLALACGFLFSEGMISSHDDIAALASCGPRQALGHQNIVKVDLRPEHAFRWESLERHFYTTSSCGICGKSSLDAVEVGGLTKASGPASAQDKLAPELFWRLPGLLEAAQQTFQQTGGLHASGLFTRAGQLALWAEDVGRHNALDKVVGMALRQGRMPLTASILLLSGRASFELLQKAIKAGVAIVVAIGAPSSLAVDLAVRFNVLLIGFLGPQRFNVYHNNGYL